MNIVAHNLLAMNAQRQFNINVDARAKSSEKLSSGFRINRAADDAAGLQISEKMRSQVRGLNQGSDNIQDGISLVQIADGALAEVNSMLNRMTELSVKSANGTNTTAERNAIQSEISELTKEIDRIGKSTQFNTMPLFDDIDKSNPNGKLTELVKCAVLPKGTNDGHIMDTFQDDKGKWHAAAIMDFSCVNLENIESLDGQSFSFTCSDSCSEAFKIGFNFGRGDSCANLEGAVEHEYNIDIKGCKNGSEVLDRALKYIKEHPSTKSPGSENKSQVKGALGVSHSNGLIRKGDKIVIFSERSHNTKAEAKAQGEGYGSTMGAVKCSDMNAIMVHNPVFEIPIQCSGSRGDFEVIRTRRVNKKILGLDKVDASTLDGAREAMKQIEDAGDIIDSYRSELGSYQNRLESAFNSNENTAENTTAAESSIRDADMAQEMVTNSKLNILTQVGTSMMAQANQSNQGVLSLLG